MISYNIGFLGVAGKGKKDIEEGFFHCIFQNICVLHNKYICNIFIVLLCDIYLYIYTYV